MEPYDELPIAEFGFPGALRDLLIAAILDGSKTSTSSTVIEYSIEDEPYPAPGRRSLVIDSAGIPVAVIETTGVELRRIGEVDLEHAIAEGEGYTTVADWRESHTRYWQSDEMRDYLGDPAFVVDDSTEVFLERFTLISRLERTSR